MKSFSFALLLCFALGLLAEQPASHWAFQPLTRPTAPELRNTRHDARNPLDAFLLVRLKQEGLALTPEADRPTLLRRLKFDLLGLPPTPEEVAAFVADTTPFAYERQVERYLASPHYGERWARHWLDAVRFAESDGFETNLARPNAWPYRDYVIRALNDDRPYDQFLREQLAGDLLGVDEATGFLVGGPYDKVKSPDIALTLQQRADELHDIVSTTSSTFLGLTVGCARCHDHKFDPISQRDYYAMKALFAGVQHGERVLRPADAPQREQLAQELRKQLAAVEASLAQHEPLAYPFPTLLLEDDTPVSTPAAAPSVTQLVARAGLEPHKPGTERGQRDDAGDIKRLPNLGRNYSWWPKVADKDVFTWNPKVHGRFRVWLSWGCGWKTHAPDAVYLLDQDGDLATRDDQKVVARVDQRKFADGSGDMPGQPLWSGLYDAGLWELTAKSRLILRAGASEAVVTADLLVLQGVGSRESDKAGLPLALRLPVSSLRNVERFAPIEARYVRMSIFETTQYEPCLDELEVFTAGPNARNVALASNGTKAMASGNYSGHSIHKLEHVNDGQYGNSRSWISNTIGKGWVQLEFPERVRIDRIVWGRDRQERYKDRTATKYRIEVAIERGQWQTVASSDDRLPMASKITSLPAASRLAEPEVAAFTKLATQKRELEARLKETVALPQIYAGRFTAPEATHRLNRGDVLQKREPVAPAALADFGSKLELAENATDAERRLALAKWITDARHPLTARVLVNRLWQHHFGTGLVSTPSDFGLNGGRPSHPELLDWLASEFLANGWRLKPLHRLIVTSSTYRQASTANPRGLEVDAASRLLWRYPPRRLEAEPLRDALLFVSGKLNPTMGGPGFDLFEPNGNYVKVYTPKREFSPPEWRRMIYQSKPRMQLDDVFGSFDCPDAGQIAPKRNSSTTALQALNLLNSAFLLQQADAFAERLRRESGEDATAQVRRGFALAFQREPTKVEQAAATALVKEHGLTALCRALFNANEFVFVR